jgi:hypothetical protein
MPLLILPLFWLGACGETDPGDQVQPEAQTASNDSEAIDACSLISKAEAEEAVGLTFQDPESTPYNPVSKSSECKFQTTDTSSGIASAGGLQVRAERLSNPAANFAGLRELLGEGEEVSGVGDEAFYVASQLFVLSGTHQVHVTVSLFGNRGDERRDVAVKVAETILPRL